MYHPPINPVYIHIDVADHLAGRTVLRRRANMRLRDLMARGSLIRAKSTKGNTNKGWLRTPLGGQHGNQFYMWWTRTELPAFGQQSRKDEFEHSIWVRAVRHHDDHDKLPFGDIESYYPFEQPDIIDDDLFSEEPWTDVQMRVFKSQHSVNVIYGHPGSGKTTTLLKVIEDSHRQKVLFSTLSRELTSVASEYIDLMAPVDTDVLAYDYLSLLSLLCRKDISRPSPSVAIQNFRRTLDLLRLRHDQIGPWKGNEEALYAEIRAILLGRAVPGEQDSYVMKNGMSRLNGNAYRALRSHRNGVGEDAMSSALQIIRALEANANLPDLFPELAAASTALSRLKKDGAPRRLEGLNRILIDEIQDLTLLETRVMVDLASALKGTYQQPPTLFVAGDEGQTVRHSGFAWNWMNSLLYRCLRKPAEFELDSKLRTPHRISRVVENSLTLYKQLERGDRPGNQKREVFDDDTDGQVCYVELTDRNAAISLLDTFADADIIKVVAAGSEIPDWVPADLRNFILTPLMVKGLEYSNICVLNPGAALANVTQSHGGASSEDRLAGHRNRTVIDNLRVALSRATDVLVFVDVSPTAQMRTLSKELLGDAAVSLSADELMSDVLNDEVTPRERIETRLRDVAGLLDTEPALAWHRAVQAQLLHNRADTHLGEQVDRTVVRVAARFLVDGYPEDINPLEVAGRAFGAFASLGQPVEEAVFAELASWTTNRTNSPLPLMRLIQGADREMEWLHSALAPIHQTLLAGIRSAALNVNEAEAFTERVDEWLELLAFPGDIDVEVVVLRALAFHTLYDARRTEGATKMLELLPRNLIEVLAQKAEGRGEREKAIFLFEFLNLPDEVNRVVKDKIDEHKKAMLYHLMSGENLTAIAEANEILALDPKHSGALHSRATAYLYIEDFPKALKDLNAGFPLLTEDSDKSKAMVLKGKALHGMGNRDVEAGACYQKALEIKPDNSQAYKALAQFHRRKGAFDYAISSWVTLIDEFPSELEEASLELADLYSQELEEYERAVDVLSAALERQPKSKPLRLARVDLYGFLEAEDEILEDMEYLADIYPADKSILWRLADDYAVNGMADEAIEICKKVVAMNADDYDAHRRFGDIYATLHDHTESKSFLTKAIRQVNTALDLRGNAKDSVQAQLYYERGRAYRRRAYSGDRAKAFQDIENSRRCDPAFMRDVIGTRIWL